jgi:hypothetical protein
MTIAQRKTLLNLFLAAVSSVKGDISVRKWVSRHGALSSPQFLYHKFLVSLIRFQEQAVAYQARGVA